MSIEDQTRSLLNDVLITIPLARRSGTPEEHLQALMYGALCFPVFAGWPSPVEEWLNEGEELSRTLGDDESCATILIRRGAVRMRKLELDSALAELDRARPICLTPSCRSREALTRARVYIRTHEFDRAKQSLTESAVGRGDEMFGLFLLARGEFEIEVNQIPAARATLKKALERLTSDSIEERIQTVQSLAFVAISQGDINGAMKHLAVASQMLRGAGVWSEVAQMDVTLGSFELSLGRVSEAQTHFDEAIQICEQYPGQPIETILRLGMARLRADTGDHDSAIAEAVKAATVSASQGNALGYVGVIIFIHALYLQERDFPAAYRVLATGLGIAKKLRLPVAETILRAQVNRMRDETLGPKKFDDMAQKMIDELKQQKQSGEQPDFGVDD